MDLEAAAELLGVHYQTAYRLVRNGVLPAVRVGFGYELDPADVAAVRDERRRRRASAGSATTDWWQQHEELAGALLRGDEGLARRQLERLQGEGSSAVDLCEKLISPVIRRLEVQQEAGKLLPAEVAAAADFCERLVATMASPLPGRPRGLAVVASPVGEYHRLPSLMATAALRASRWRVLHLGSGVPARDLGEMVEETEPAVVVLSLTMRTDAAQEFCQSLAESTSVPVVAGGAGEGLSQLLERVGGAVRPKRDQRTAASDLDVDIDSEALLAEPAHLLAEA